MELKPQRRVITPGAAVMTTRVAPMDASVALAGVEVIEAEEGYSKPSLLVTGASGTGKTYMLERILARLAERGERGLVLGIENKWQKLAKYRPMVLVLTKPVDGKKPTATQVYDRMMAVVDAIAAGKYRDVGGGNVTLLAVDGVMEACQIIERKMKAAPPVASSTGEKNSYALFDQIGEKAVDFFKAIRDAASEATRAYGATPLGVVATCGEALDSKLGRPTLVLPGNIAPRSLPFQFEAVLRLAVERTHDGEPLYVAHTVTADDWFAKLPSIGYGAKIEMPDGGVIYDKLIEYYRSPAKGGGESGEGSKE